MVVEEWKHFFRFLVLGPRNKKNIIHRCWKIVRKPGKENFCLTFRRSWCMDIFFSNFSLRNPFSLISVFDNLSLSYRLSKPKLYFLLWFVNWHFRKLKYGSENYKVFSIRLCYCLFFDENILFNVRILFQKNLKN